MIQKKSISEIAQQFIMTCEAVYVIDPVTGRCAAYRPGLTDPSAAAEPVETDFSEVRGAILGRIAPESRNLAEHIFDISTITGYLQRSTAFSAVFRFILDSSRVWYRMKAISCKSGEDENLILCLENVDTQMAIQKELANIYGERKEDALTGVKNLFSYQEDLQKLSESLSGSVIREFAFVVCNINDLTKVNEEKGMTAGDQYLKDACKLICHTFKHSPVYRTGGDEFVVILKERDYKDRFALIKELRSAVVKNQEEDRVVIASGLASFDAQTDQTVEAVYEKAVAQMTIVKAGLKGSV